MISSRKRIKNISRTGIVGLIMTTIYSLVIVAIGIKIDRDVIKSNVPKK